MENQDISQSQNSLNRLNAVVEELINTIKSQKASYQQELSARNNKIAGLQTEIQNLNNALNNRKTQIEELENKNQLLSAQLAEAQSRLENSADNSAETARLQTLLDEAIAKSTEWEEKCNAAQESLKQNQQEIVETSEQIDGVIARLEKVLEENGASNNND